MIEAQTHTQITAFIENVGPDRAAGIRIGSKRGEGEYRGVPPKRRDPRLDPTPFASPHNWRDCIR